MKFHFCSYTNPYLCINFFYDRYDNKVAEQSIHQLLVLMKELNLPITIAQLGINVFDNQNLDKIADFTCRDGSEIHFLPFEISKQDVVEVIANFENQKIKI